MFAAWLSAFNSGSKAEMLAYHEAHPAHDPPSEDFVDRELQLSHWTGGFELKRGGESTPTRFVGILKERDSDQFAHAVMDVHAAPPYPVVNLEIHPIPTPEDLCPPRLSEREALRALRLEIDKAVQRDRFSGVVLVARDGTPIFAEAFGLADRAAPIPNTLDTRFRLASIRKMFTGTAVLRLVQDGRLTLTASLGDIVADYPNREVASKVTIHHLLTHTGGTGSIDREPHRLELRAHADYIRLFSARDLLFEPGARYEYSNYGFILLGAVIEAVTETSYHDAVDALVFQPAGMTATGSRPEEEHVANLSIGYTRSDRQSPWTPNTDRLPYCGDAAAGGYSTTTDLLKFADALTKHRLLDRAHTRLLTTGTVPCPWGKYGYGFVDTVDGGVRRIGHTGDSPGANGALSIWESGYTVVVLSNMDPPTATRLATFVGIRLPAQ